FEGLWSPAEGADRAGVWQRIRQGLSATDLRLLRSRLYHQALRRVQENPERNLGTAVELVRALDDAAPPRRPAEAHDLLMFARDRVVPPRDRPLDFDESLARAGRVRHRGEAPALGVAIESGSQFPYCEQVEPWIRSHVDEGDRERRIGQDLLFASEPARWAESIRRLADADRKYGEALTTAAVVRSGLAVRDAVWPVLP